MLRGTQLIRPKLFSKPFFFFFAFRIFHSCLLSKDFQMLKPSYVSSLPPLRRWLPDVPEEEWSKLASSWASGKMLSYISLWLLDPRGSSPNLSAWGCHPRISAVRPAWCGALLPKGNRVSVLLPLRPSNFSASSIFPLSSLELIPEGCQAQSSAFSPHPNI